MQLLSSKIIESAVARFEPLQRIYIAYSGGVDSHVLLHLTATPDQLHKKVTAVYVHHGLLPEAESWSRHCKKTAEDLGVDYILLRVNAHPGRGESPEEAARNARYSALKELVGVNDVLLVAQHLEDQLETVMLQLLRGSGLRGLSGMPESAVFGRGVMLRPLLNTAKQAISDYAENYRLNWVEDPSNRVNDFDRNFLRNQVTPLLKQRWPSCPVTVARTARHCADAEIIISELADEIFKQIHSSADNTISISRLRSFNNAKQRLAIRHWFLKNNLKMPTQVFVTSLLNQVADAGENSQPVLPGQGCRIRRYRDKLYLLKQVEPETKKDIIWPLGQTTLKIGADSKLSWMLSSTGIPLEQWLNSKIVIKSRCGGEKIKLPGRIGHHSLKNLFQEAGIPPWERENIPLIYLNDKLAAIGDRWISAEFHDQRKDACIVLSMQEHE